ncbi:MAG: SIMPL domain-containing protein, partial [Actinomycetota bacterium]|nr:SIMPL domain-containing protein [Actinomycetota bacterium]
VHRERDNRGNVVGYAGSSAVVVETQDLESIGDVIDVGTDAGADSVRGVDFDLEENSAAVRQALRKAMTIAQGKAEALATTAGRTLGRALVIRESGTRDPGPVAALSALAAAPGPEPGSGGGNAFPIIPPDITVRTRIEVTFALS